MGRREGRILLTLAGATLAWALACETSPGFARLALDRFARPVTAKLHELTAMFPFPVAELAALLLAGGCLWGLARAAASAVRRRALAPLGRWLAGVCRVALALAAGLALLWSPARGIPSEAPPTPDARQLEWLCGHLIDALNASALDFPAAAESLSLAPEVAGVGSAVKAVRYPEWARAARLSGLFVPLTGEALADASAPAALLPFTAVHELTHLAGVADEGAANIAAWRLCLDAGGAFADSARLWALRYALGLLGREDPVARLRVQGKMKDALSRVFTELGGDIAAEPPTRPTLSRGDYAALAGYLAGFF